MRAYGHISREKVSRKIHYLRRMGRPNTPGGATAGTWQRFWHVLHKLQLTKKLQYYY